MIRFLLVFGVVTCFYGQVTVIGPPVMVEVDITVNWEPQALTNEKYGKLPSWAYFGEITACNRGSSNVTFGEGDLIAAISQRSLDSGLNVFSRLDAIMLVSNSQRDSTKNIVSTILSDVSQTALQAGLLIGVGGPAGLGLVIGTGLLRLILPKVDGILNLRQLRQYVTSGIQTTNPVAAGRCTIPMDVLFALPRTATLTVPESFRLNVPVER